MVLGLFLITNSIHAQFYNGTHVGFGKNRVQYDLFEWEYFRYDQYETYFYTGGKELAIYTAKVARDHIKDQEKFFEHDLREKIQFIVYNKQSHFKQSNVGLSSANGELGGITNIMGSKVYIYFNGNHADFDKQIKEGIAQIMINQQVYGSNWRQVFKNASLFTIPEWYSKGLTSYMSEKWSVEIENSVRDGIVSGKYKKFNRLSKKDAVYAGHSLWAYIVDTYGESVVPNILYMSRITQSINKGYLYVLGVSMKNLIKEWEGYYKKAYQSLLNTKDEKLYKKEPFKIKKRRDYSEFKMSPDGDNFAFVTNQLGQYKIYIYYKGNDKKFKIYKNEFKIDRLNDYSYPILEWHPSSENLTFVTEEKGALLMHFFDINTGGVEVKSIFKMEKITSMDYSDNGKEMVFSGVYKGQSDLYLYYVRSNSHKKITNDAFDDLEPRFIENSTKIVFTSNRLTDSLGYHPTDLELFSNQKDVWIISNIKSKKDKKLTRVTKTDFSEKQPAGTDSMLYYLGEENNVLARYSAVKDSFITHIDTSIHYYHFYETKPATNFEDRSVKEHNFIPDGQYTEVVRKNYKYHLSIKNVNEIQPKTTAKEVETPNESDVKEKIIPITTVKPVTLKQTKIVSEENSSDMIDIKSYVFEKDKNEIQRNAIVIGEGAVLVGDSTWHPVKIPNHRNYNISFFNDNSALKMSNSFVNGEYQQFTGGPYTSPGVGALFKFATIDLFEDQKIYGGVRLSSRTREYFMTYQNLEKRMDKEYTFSRTTSNLQTDFSAFGLSTNTFNYSLKYAFSEVTSLRTTFSVRNDNINVKSTDQFALTFTNFREYRGIIKLAYVFDNTRKKMTNIYYGTKFKLFGEYYQEFGDGSFISEEVKFNKDNEARGKGNGVNGNLKVVGLDFRHSQKISREIVWVNRIAASSSFGFEKLIYYLGSTDDWIPFGQDQFINEDDVNPQNVNYRYHALAANLRGFPQNIRRGTNFAVINSELRFPVFKYLIKKPIRSKFINNFQIIGFTDVGSAWSGLNPWSKDNRINKDVVIDGVVGNESVRVTVFKNIDPIVAGYGFGLRSTVLGYFLRLDWAWGVENGVTKDKPIFYLSLSLDI